MSYRRMTVVVKKIEQQACPRQWNWWDIPVPYAPPPVDIALDGLDLTGLLIV